MESKITVDPKVVRGKESWAYIYVALAFALAIEGTIIQMITPLVFPYNILLYALTSAVTVWLFLFNGRFHNKLIALKGSYESKPR